MSWFYSFFKKTYKSSVFLYHFLILLFSLFFTWSVCLIVCLFAGEWFDWIGEQSRTHMAQVSRSFGEACGQIICGLGNRQSSQVCQGFVWASFCNWGSPGKTFLPLHFIPLSSFCFAYILWMQTLLDKLFKYVIEQPLIVVMWLVKKTKE